MEPFPFSKKHQGGKKWKAKERKEKKKRRGSVAVGDINGKIGKVGGEEKEDEEEWKLSVGFMEEGGGVRGSSSSGEWIYCA